MKSFIVFALFVAAAVALPTSVDPKTATIVTQEVNNIGVDGYQTRFKRSNGKNAKENASLKNVGTENKDMPVRRLYTYVDDLGDIRTISYIEGDKDFELPGVPLSEWEKGTQQQ